MLGVLLSFVLLPVTERSYERGVPFYDLTVCWK